MGIRHEVPIAVYRCRDRGVAELLLDEALVDLGRGGEASAQRMAGEGLATLSFRQITSHPGGERHSLD